MLYQLLIEKIKINVDDPLIILPCLFVLLSWVSIIWSYDLETTLNQNRTYTLLPMFFIIIKFYKFNNNEILLIKKMVIASMILLIIYYYVNYKEIMLNSYPRFVLNDKNDPNNLAAHLIMPYFVIVIFFINGNSIDKILSIVVMICASFVVFLTGSRGAVIALFSGISYIIFYTYRKINNKQAIFLVVFVIIISYLVLNYLPGDLIERLFTINSYLSDKDVYGTRSGIWKNIITYVIPQMPLCGFGAGVSGYILIDFYGYIKGVHNTYLNMILEYGILGLPLFLVFIIYLYKYIKKRGNILYNSILISMLLVIFFLDSFEKKYFWNAMMFLVIISNEKNNST